MLIYILKFSACLLIFMVFYKVFLEKTSIHNFKRFYLLSVMVLALAIPNITFVNYVEPAVVSDFENFAPISNIQMDELPQEASVDYAPIILWSIYAFGVIIFLLKFCLNLKSIILKIKSNPKHKSSSFINVLVEHLKVPHTFFSYIFLNKHEYEHNEIVKEVLLHEQTHAKQKHSVDVLILEVLQIIFWFNPLIYLLKKEVKLNHEFLADRAVLQNGIEPSAYQHLLLVFSSLANEPQLANAINYSSIKKRFTVMKTQTSKTSIWLRSLLLLPLIGLTLYGFSQTIDIEKEITSETASIESIDLYLNEKGELFYEDRPYTYVQIETLFKDNDELHVSVKCVPDVEPELSLGLVKKLREIGIKKLTVCTSREPEFKGQANIQQIAIPYTTSEKEAYYKNVTFQIMDKDGHVISTKTYSELTSEEKDQLHPPIGKPKKKSPTHSDLNRWKDSKRYGIWLDGKQIKNSYLNTFLPSSFSLFYESKLAKNALNYGKHFYQVNLYSETYFNTQFPSETTPLSNKVIISITKSVSQQKATAEQLVEYNKLAKHCNAQLEQKERPIIKHKNIVRLKQLYSIMSMSQKEKAEPFPDFSKLPPPPPPAKTSSKVVEVEVPLPPPPPIPENASPEEKERMKKVTEAYRKKYPKSVSKVKLASGEIVEVVEVPTDLNVPTPPTPKSPLDHIINMAKQNALFYVDNKNVSSDEVIHLLKKDASVHIQTINENSEQPSVLISHNPKIKNSKEIPKPNRDNIVSHIKVMNRHGATFYLGRKEISYEDALKYVRKHKDADVTSSADTNTTIIKPNLVGVLGNKKN